LSSFSYIFTCLQGGRFAPEWVTGFNRNGWPVYVGITGRLESEYSVPMQYQRGEVYVRSHAGELLVHDVSGKRVTTWKLGAGKGEVFKNANHYRDPAEQISDLEAQVTTLLGETDSAELRVRIRRANPRIYKDQLHGLCKELTRLGAIEAPIMARLLARDAVSVRQFVDAVEAWRAHPERLQEATPPAAINSALLQAYGEVTSHAIH